MNMLVFALLAGAIGLAISGGELSGGLAGAFAGLLAGWVSGLSTRIERLERQIAALAHAPKAAPTSADTPAGTAPDAAAPRAPAAAAAPRPPATATEPAPAAPGIELAGPAAGPRAADRPATPAPARARPAAAQAAARAETRARMTRRVELEPSRLDDGFAFIKRWFTTGNVPVKVGVVLSVFGVGFLVKEGVDRQWLVLPLELRLMFVALFGIALLVLGWRLRHRERTYALSVQGGGVAVLYLTIYASFWLFHLLPSAAAFALLLVVTAAAGTLAVLQDSRALAVLGIVGGFMAPVLVSSGSGNHVALFSYYAILNVAIVGIAWFKAWRELNVLGFLFTFGIGSLWGYQSYAPAHFASTEPFLILFVLMYIAIPVLFASRQAPALRGFVDGTLTFGTPIVGFALQSQLVGDTEYGLAISAIALAALYVGLATFLLKRGAAELRVMVEAQFALSVAFLTVAIPLALDARWTSAAWALQGAAMVWLGFRQQRRLALAAGIVLQLLSGAAYVDQVGAPAEWAVLNGRFLGAFLLALAGGFSGRLFEAPRVAAAAGPPRRPIAGARSRSRSCRARSCSGLAPGGFGPASRRSTDSCRLVSSPRLTCCSSGSPRCSRWPPQRVPRGRGSMRSASCCGRRRSSSPCSPFPRFRIRRHASAGSPGRRYSRRCCSSCVRARRAIPSCVPCCMQRRTGSRARCSFGKRIGRWIASPTASGPRPRRSRRERRSCC